MLTKSEEAIIEAKKLADTLSGAVKAPMTYQIGEGAKSSMPFMRDYILFGGVGTAAGEAAAAGVTKLAVKIGGKNAAKALVTRGIAKAGEAAAARATRLAVKIGGKNAAKSLVTRGTAKIVDGLTGALVHTPITPSSYEIAGREMAGTYNPITGFTSREGTGSAALTAYIENFSERLGSLFFQPFLERMSVPRLSFTALKRAGKEDVLVEDLEEQFVGIIDVLRGRQTWDDYTSIENQAVTAGTVALVPLPMKALEMVGRTAVKMGDASDRRRIMKALFRSEDQLRNIWHERGTADEFIKLVDEDIEAGRIDEVLTTMTTIANSDNFTNDEKTAAADYIIAKAAEGGMKMARQERETETVQRVASTMKAESNQTTGTLMSVNMSENDDAPVQVTQGNIVVREDGSIDLEQSDETFYYIDSNGEPQIGLTKDIHSIAENIPVSTAVEEVMAPMAEGELIAEENESAAARQDFKEGDALLYDDSGTGNGVNIRVTYRGTDENGNYIVETEAGEQIQVEPRFVASESEGTPFDNGVEVTYTDENGQTRTGTVEDAYSMRNEGLVRVDGKDIRISDIKSVKNDKGRDNENEGGGTAGTSATERQGDVDNPNGTPTNEVRKSADSGVQGGSASEGVKRGTAGEDTAEGAVEPPVGVDEKVGQEEAAAPKVEYPRDKEGNIDYDNITDPDTYASAMREEFGDEAEAILEENIAAAREDVAKAENSKGDAIKRARAKNKAKAALAALEAVKARLTAQETVSPSGENGSADGVSGNAPSAAPADELNPDNEKQNVNQNEVKTNENEEVPPSGHKENLQNQPNQRQNDNTTQPSNQNSGTAKENTSGKKKDGRGLWSWERSRRQKMGTIGPKAFRALMERLGIGDRVVIDEDEMRAVLEKYSGKTGNIRLLASSAGEIYGFTTPDGKIYIDPYLINANTMIHETGHLWWKMMPADIRAKITEIVKQTKFWKELENNPAYDYLETDDEKADEIFNTLLGYYGEYSPEVSRIVGDDITLWAKIKSAIDEFMIWLRARMGSYDDKLTEFAKRTLGDLLEGKAGNIDKNQLKSTGSDIRLHVRQEYANQRNYDFDVSGITKENADEMKRIKDAAVANGTFMKAPNGKKSNLNEREWLQVRTPKFKAWFGDWEKQAQINKLRESKPIEITGKEIDDFKEGDDIKEFRKKALEYGKTLRGEYKNKDTGETIKIIAGKTRGGIKEVLHHDYENADHLRSVAAIPQIIENGIRIESFPNEKTNNSLGIKEYRYYVTGLKIDGEDYTVRAIVGVSENGDLYYDHRLTQIEKEKLIDSINGVIKPAHSQSVNSETGFTTTGKESTPSYSDLRGKDTKLISILQINSQEISKVTDENGEPDIAHHETDEPFTIFKRENTLHDAFFFSNTNYYNTNEVDALRKGATINAFLNIRNPLLTTEDETFPDYSGRYTDRIKPVREAGYDGIIRTVNIDGVDYKVFVAFNSEQIKSSENNNGNFDDANPDIRFQIVGETKADNVGKAGNIDKNQLKSTDSDVRFHEKESQMADDSNNDLKNIKEQIAEAEKEVDTNPSEAQKKAGNYKMGHVRIQGFDITIENKKGSIRRGIDENGSAWETKMHNTYGYFGNTESKDGDHIDVFLGFNPLSKKIFVVDQVNPKTGAFDEHKVMFGFDTIEDAQKSYLLNYEKGWKGLGNITETDIETFRKWAVDTEGKRIKPFSDYSVNQPNSSRAGSHEVMKERAQEIERFLNETEEGESAYKKF